MIRHKRIIFMLLFTLLWQPEHASATSCYDGPAPVIINEDADVYIGVLMGVRVEDETTGKSCGEPQREAVEFYEGLRWFLSMVNQNSGQVLSRIVKDSYIPGVKIGLKIFDNCGEMEVAEKQLGALIPDLESSECSEESEHDVIGLIDCIGISDQQEIQEILDKSHVPVMNVELDTFLSADEVAEGMVNFAKQLNWERVIVLYNPDSYSKDTMKHLSRSAEICIDSFIDVNDEEALKRYLDKNNGVNAAFVISPVDEAEEILQSFGNDWQFLLSQPWTSDDAKFLETLVGTNKIFMLTASPHEIESFESYWTKRKNPQLPKAPENLWLLEYSSKLKKCKIPGVTEDSPDNASWLPCHNFNIQESTLDKLMRHSRVIPVIHVLNTYASAIRKAWETHCEQIPGYCDKLRNMERAEFFEDIFSKAEFRHDGPGSRIPAGFSALRKPLIRNELADVRLALLHASGNASRTKAEVISTYQQTSGISGGKSDFVPQPSKCVKSCAPCASAAASTARLRNYVTLPSTSASTPTSTSATPRQDEDLQTSTTRKIEITEKTPKKEENSTRNVIEDSYDVIELSRDVMDSFDDVVIPALFPIHKAGPTPLQCGAEVNQDAVKDIEAFLWALDQVNSNPEILNGLTIGAVIFDTCSSPLKAAHLVSSIMANEGDTMLEEIEINPEKLLTFLAVTSGAEAEAASAILDPARITTISAKERGESRKFSKNKLQIEVPMSLSAKALTEVIRKYGWNFISVIYGDSDPDSGLGFRIFEELVESSEVCFALVENINKTAKNSVYEKLLEDIVKKSEIGANVVVLWTNQEETTKIIENIENSSLVEKLKNILWISATGWPSVKHKMKLPLNWISIRPELSVVEEFQNRFRVLEPEVNHRNPWFGEFWEQTKNCTLPGCPEVPETTTSVIQSVYIIASALARVVQEHCPTPYTGLEHCHPKILELRQLLFKYLKYTGTDRADDAEGEFRFTGEGFGNTPIEIARLEQLQYNRIGSFVEDVLVVHEPLSPGTIAECGFPSLESCSRCLEKQQNQVLLKESKDNVYIAGLFDIRQKNPDGRWYCGLNVTQSGFQEAEAFLWALDYVSNVTNVSIGGLGIDGCGSNEKRTNDLLRIIRNPAEVLPEDSQILGIFFGSQIDDQKLLIDIHNRFKLPAVTSTPITKLTGSSPVFQFGPSVDLIADSLIQIVKSFNWSYVSVVCSSDWLVPAVLCEEFHSAATNFSIKFAADVTVDTEGSSPGYWESISEKIRNKTQDGAHVLVTMATESENQKLLTALKKSWNTKQPIVIISWNSGNILKKFSDWFSAAVVLETNRKYPEMFQEFLENLSPNSRTYNPWRNRFWKQEFNCRGSACDKFRLEKNLEKNLDKTTDTINGVLAIVSALERVRKEFCPLKETFCSKMPEAEQLRVRIQNAMEDYAFTDLHGNANGFHSNGIVKDMQIDITNIYENSIKRVGYYSTKGLTIDKSIVKAKNFDRIDSIQSICKNCEKSIAKPWQPSNHMRILPKNKTNFNLISFLPFHRQGVRPLSCGSVNSAQVFQNLVAVSYALQRAQRNASLPQVGAVVFDTCGRSERAQQRLLSALGNASDVVSGSELIGAVTLDGETSLSLANVLAEGNIPQFSVPLDGFRAAVQEARDSEWRSVAGNPILKTVHEPQDEPRALFQVLQKLEWKHVIIFFDDSTAGEYDRDVFVNAVHGSDGSESSAICIGAQVRIPRPGRTGNEPLNLHGLLEAIENDLPPVTVAVLLLHNTAQVERVISAILDTGLAGRIVVLANHAWGKNNEILHENSVNQLATIVTVSMETYEVPGFQDFISQLTLEKHGTIPDDWFEEFFQNHFECQLENSRVAQKVFQKRCTGTERFTPANLQQDPYVYHTIFAVETFVQALSEFLEHGKGTGSGTGSGGNEKFSNFLKDVVRRRDFVSRSGGLQIWKVQFDRDVKVFRDDNKFHLRGSSSAFYEPIGIYRQSQLELDWRRLKFSVPDIRCAEGSCLNVCNASATKFSRIPEVPANFSKAWGVVTIAFSVLGLILVTSCTVYFLRNLRKTSASSVLTYGTLAGLCLLYVTSICYLLQPTDTSCGLRRFLLGIAYATTFAGLLLRSYHSWRRITHGGAATDPGTCSGSSTQSLELIDTAKPPGLLLSTLTLIAVQVIILSAWLIFKPPTAVALSSGTVRCSPVENFETELLISLVFPMVVLLTATVFSFCVCRSSDAPSDAKAMLLCCCLLVATWLSWSVVATQAEEVYREPAIVIGIIVCAKIILLILYGRRVYDIAVHRQEARNLAVLSQFSSKSLQPSLQNFDSMNTTLSAIYTTELDGAGVSESGAASAEDAALGLCLGLATGQLSRRNSCRSLGRRKVLERESSPPGSFDGEFFANRIVPSPIFPVDRMSLRSRCRSPDEDHDDSEDFQFSRHRSFSRRGSMELPAAQPPLVRRVGSRQMLVLGDEASVHGRVSKI